MRSIMFNYSARATGIASDSRFDVQWPGAGARGARAVRAGE